MELFCAQFIIWVLVNDERGIYCSLCLLFPTTPTASFSIFLHPRTAFSHSLGWRQTFLSLFHSLLLSQWIAAFLHLNISMPIITITYFFLKNGVLKYNYGGSESVKQCGGINKSFQWSNACEVLHFLCFREEQDELPLLIERSPIALMQPMLKNEMASAKLAAIADIKVWGVLSSQKKTTNIHFFKGGKYTATENKREKNRYRFCLAKPSLALSLTACGSQKNLNTIRLIRISRQHWPAYKQRVRLGQCEWRADGSGSCVRKRWSASVGVTNSAVGAEEERAWQHLQGTAMDARLWYTVKGAVLRLTSKFDHFPLSIQRRVILGGLRGKCWMPDASNICGCPTWCMYLVRPPPHHQSIWFSLGSSLTGVAENMTITVMTVFYVTLYYTYTLHTLCNQWKNHEEKRVINLFMSEAVSW